MQRVHLLRIASLSFYLAAGMPGLLSQIKAAKSPARRLGSTIPLHESSRQTIASETGGAFMFPSKCDADGNLYIRKYATDRPLLSPVVKIDTEGKRVARFDPTSFTQLKIDRVDDFSPAADGGLYQIATVGIAKPQTYVLHFSSDGTPLSSTLLEAEFRPFQFAAFASGDFLATGFEGSPQAKSDSARSYTGVFSADGRLLAQLALRQPTAPDPAKTKATGGAVAPPVSKPGLDLSAAEPGRDGNIYAVRRSSPALLYVISPAGVIERTLKVSGPAAGVAPNTFHVSGNRVAISFWDDRSNKGTIVVVDAQTGRRVATYSDGGALGPSFTCYSADENAFTFLHLGDGNTLEIIRAEP